MVFGGFPEGCWRVLYQPEGFGRVFGGFLEGLISAGTFSDGFRKVFGRCCITRRVLEGFPGFVREVSGQFPGSISVHPIYLISMFS